MSLENQKNETNINRCTKNHRWWISQNHSPFSPSQPGNEPVNPYPKTCGTTTAITGQKTKSGSPIRLSLWIDQNRPECLSITNRAKKPARMKNTGIRHTWINSNRILIGSEWKWSDGQMSFGKYGSAACRTIPRAMANARTASSPWYLIFSWDNLNTGPVLVKYIHALRQRTIAQLKSRFTRT